MNNKLVTKRCPHCGMSTVELDASIPHAAPVNIFGRTGYFTLKLRCSSCGWLGEEKWDCWYSGTATTYTPQPPKPKTVEPTAPMFGVESSVIKAIGYDRMKECLYVRFQSTDVVYGYEDVPLHLAMDFLNSDSKGHFYNNHIRGRYGRV